jgi:septum formation protein
MSTLFLASQSPRRAALIRLLGVRRYEVMPADLHEAMLAELSPAENVQRLAFDKAKFIANQLSPDAGGVVLGADTTVVLDGQMLEKPTDEFDAERMLSLLSGRTHTVYTGVSLVPLDERDPVTFVEATEVTFRHLSVDEIRAYIATGSPMDKAGAYGIQEDHGAVFVKRIVGDYYNVVGLPICSVYERLSQLAPEILA